MAMNKSDVFNQPSGEGLGVVICCPTRVCNYECDYCERSWRDDVDGTLKWDEAEFLRWESCVDLIIEKIQRPLYMVIHPTMGEPLVIPRWWDVFDRLVKSPKVESVNFVSNLSKPIMERMERVDVGKIGLKASFHPSQFRSEKDLSFFIGQATALQNAGATVLVGYVFEPGQMKEMHRYRRIFQDAGLLFSGNIMMGNVNGSVYPEAYTAQEKSQLEEFLSSEPFIFDYQTLRRKSLGESCSAGRHCIFVDMDGYVYACQFTRERLGSLMDDELFLFDENFKCTANYCRCHYSIGLMERIYREFSKSIYVMSGYEKRLPGKIGDHPFT